MKLVYYKRLIADNYDLTASERIIYSFMLSRSIMSIDDVFDVEGKSINTDVIDEHENDDYGYIDLPSDWFDENGNTCCVKKIARTTNIVQSTVSYSFKTLDNRGLISIKDKKIYMGDIWRSGYFELLKEKHPKLRSELLIFYSWICDYSKVANYIVSASVDKLAEQYNTSRVAMRDLIHRLHKLGLAERLDNGKLLIK